MCIFPATLETMVSCGHSWEAVSFLILGASVCGSNAHTESGGASPGNSTSRNSRPDGCRCGWRAWDNDTACCGADHRLLGSIVVKSIVPSPRITWRLAGRTAISLDSMKRVPAKMSTSRFLTMAPKVNIWPSQVKGKCVPPIMCRGGEPSAWWTDWELGVI